ncbi:MAG: TspO/MBR family protein [Candidatus Zixiibacteriota bacterium]
MRKLTRILGLLLLLILSAIVAWVGATFQSGEWYLQLNKPSWTPPGWLFGPVWTYLYITMAIAAWLVWIKGGWSANRAALTGYVIQMILNGLWSWIFFGRHMIGMALLDILLLLLSIIIVLILFRQRSKAAGLLFIPYVIWVSFASALNFAIWIMN